MADKKQQKKRGIPLSCLGYSALLQLQEQGVDVSKYLRDHGSPSNAVMVEPALKQHKFHVSAKEERTLDGIIFDSKLEMNAYRYLRDRSISFERQVEYVLEDGFELDGKKYRPVKYVADFVLDPKGKRLVVDTKGMKTREYMLKAKLMAKKFGIVITNIKTLPQLALLIHDNSLCQTTHPDSDMPSTTP